MIDCDGAADCKNKPDVSELSSYLESARGLDFTIPVVVEECKKGVVRNVEIPKIDDVYEKMTAKLGEQRMLRINAQSEKCGYGVEEYKKLIASEARALTHATVYFDFEASPFGVHKEYAVCGLADVCKVLPSGEFVEPDVEPTQFKSTSHNCGKEFLEWVTELVSVPDAEGKKRMHAPVIKLIAHNMTYDLLFLKKHLHKMKGIERTNKTIIFTGHYKSEVTGKFIRLVFHDSWQLISTPLSEFSNMFKLEAVKEVTSHAIMTREFIDRGALASEDDFKKAGVLEADAITKNAQEWGCISQCGRVDMIKYNAHYCMADVKLLRDGYLTFMRGTLDHMDFNGRCHATISSIGDTFFTNTGAYNGVSMMTGVNRDYVAQSAVGGRVMVRGNGKLRFARKIDDFDAVSLYASAIKRLATQMGGLPVGKEKLWHAGVDLKEVNSFVVTIEVLSVEKPDHSFPI
jgi:hypothetical protein